LTISTYKIIALSSLTISRYKCFDLQVSKINKIVKHFTY
jgi:hypothetical protein